MTAPGAVLVLGGYGAVGRHVVDHLHRTNLASRVVVAGRDRAKADALAARYGRGVSGIALDSADGAALDRAVRDVDLVVACTEAGAQDVAAACVRHGTAMVSVAASVPVLRSITAMDGDARQNGATLVTEVGLVPGLMNMLIERLIPPGGAVDRLSLVLELGFVGTHGPEAVAWSLAQAAKARSVRRLDLPAPAGAMNVVPVDFVDTDAVAARHRARSVRSFLAFCPGWITPILPTIARSLGPRSALVRSGTRLTGRLAARLGMGEESVWLCVHATGSDPTSRLALLTGRDQSRIIGLVTAETARSVLTRDPRPGVRAMGDVVALDDISSALLAIGCEITFHSSPQGGSQHTSSIHAGRHG